MSPDGGQPIVNTVLSVVRSKRDHTTFTKEWKEDAVKEFGKEEVSEARNLLKERLNKQGPKIAKTKQNMIQAMDDVVQWLLESEDEVEQLEIVCKSSFLPKVAAFLVRNNDLWPEAVVSLSTRMGIMEEHMKAMTEGINSLKKEVQKEMGGARRSSLSGNHQRQETRSGIQQQQKEKEIITPTISLQTPGLEPEINGWNDVVCSGRGFRGPNPKQSAGDREGARTGEGAGARNKTGARFGKKRMPASFGCANIEIEGVEAAPVDFFVGNTNPRTTEENLRR